MWVLTYKYPLKEVKMKADKTISKGTDFAFFEILGKRSLNGYLKG